MDVGFLKDVDVPTLPVGTLCNYPNIPMFLSSYQDNKNISVVLLTSSNT